MRTTCLPGMGHPVPGPETGQSGVQPDNNIRNGESGLGDGRTGSNWKIESTVARLDTCGITMGRCENRQSGPETTQHDNGHLRKNMLVLMKSFMSSI